nr:ribonuclease H-like domain, reverse transcriptase, RNA-dependent DNA polymerase [Tanacetum cinerariifolium]GFA89975.1 ribonuclease H-like domain, reverse transcriptase, RNA-dependent DNA polymerase [Tanacetum cinerariifolium]
MITEATIKDALRLPNEKIIAELARMGYEKPSTKLTFYKAFFSSQWKFLIHTILQCMSAKRTSWNEFSSSMASAVICISTAQEVGEVADEVHAKDVNVVGVVSEGAASDDGGIIANIDADEDVVLEDAKDAAVKKSADVEDNAEVQGRTVESQAQIYQIDLEHANKVLSMHDEEESKPAKLQEVVDVVTTTMIITEVVTAASDTGIC